jgi:hypothetical protein
MRHQSLVVALEAFLRRKLLQLVETFAQDKVLIPSSKFAKADAPSL